MKSVENPRNALVKFNKYFGFYQFLSTFMGLNIFQSDYKVSFITYFVVLQICFSLISFATSSIVFWPNISDILKMLSIIAIPIQVIYVKYSNNAI